MRCNGKAFTGRVLVDGYALVRADGTRTPIGEWDGADLEGWNVHSASEAKAFTKGFAASNAPTDIPSGSPVCTIAVSGADRNLVLLCEQSLGLFRSTDAGATWNAVPGAPSGARTVFWAGPNAPHTWYGAFNSNGIFVSRDDGLTWTTLNAPTGLPARDVVCSYADPGTVHAVFTSSFTSRTATTRNGGAIWTSVSSFTADHAANPTLPGNSATGSLSGIQNISISPVDPSRLHLPGNWDPCMSHDAGASWFESCRGADITCFHDIRFLDGVVYGAAMDEGTCKSENNGGLWTALAPLTWKAGLSGHHWRVLPQRLPGGGVRVLCTVSPWDDSGIKYPVKVIWSEDGGQTFTEARGLPDYRPIANTMWGEGHGRALAADPANPDVIYLGIDGDPESGKCGGGIFKSTDGGKTFAQLASQPGSRRMYYGLAVDPTDSNRIVWGACGNDSGVYVSNDGGGSWSRASGLYDWIYNVEITPSGVIYASGNQLYRSDDHGRSFRTVSHFPAGTVLGIAVDPANEDRVWASAASWDDNAVGGVYESTDGCANWTEITGDIPYVKPNVLRYDAGSGYLWAAGNAAFRLQVDGSEEPGGGDDEPDEPPPPDGECVWTGRVDNDWHNPGNWLGGVPGTDDVAIFTNAAPSSGSTVVLTSAVAVAKLVVARTGAFTLGAAGDGALALTAIERRDVPGNESLVTLAVPLTFLPDSNGNFTIDAADGGIRLAAAGTAGDGLLSVTKTGGGPLELAAKGAVPSGKLVIRAGTVTPSVNQSVTGKLVVGGGDEPASFVAGDRIADGVTPYVYTNGTFRAGDHVSGGPDDFHVFEGGYAYLKATYGGKVELTGGTMDIGYRMWNGCWGQHIAVRASDETAYLSGAMTAANYSNYTFPVSVEDGARPIDFVFTGSLSGNVPKFTFSGGGTMQTTGSWDIGANPSMTSMTWLMDNVGKTAGSGRGSLTVGENATLGGTGTFGGAVATQVLTVSGKSSKPATLAPGTMDADGAHVPGTLTIGTETVTNAVVFGADSRLRVTLGPDGCDALQVYGELRIAASGTTLLVEALAGFAGTGPIVLAEATGGIDGDFATVVLPEGTAWTLRKTATRLELVIAGTEHPAFAIGADLPEGVRALEALPDGSYVVRLGASLEGFTYALEYATTLVNPEWLPVAGSAVDGGETPLELLVPASLTIDRPALFLRVKATPSGE